MTWTTERPTEPGWYWWRRNTSTVYQDIYRLVLREGRLMVAVANYRHDLMDDGEWAGPLLPPESTL